MTVLVEGASFNNKGAHLMLTAVVQQMSAWSIDVAVPPNIGPFRARAGNELLQLFEVRSMGRLGPIIQLVMRPNYRALFGLVALQDCSGLLDMSGFFLGDNFRVSGWSERELQRIHALKKINKPTILMPQSFGPFSRNEKMKSFARSFLGSAVLVYARDEVSLEHARAIVPDHPGLRIAPDFTPLVEGTTRNDKHLGSAPAAIVPNNQMVARGKVTEDEYVHFLCIAARILRLKGLDPFILVHESTADRSLAFKVKAIVPAITVIEEMDPRVLKGIMGQCIVTVGSRFHGLVSALSQGVPAIGTGWSHKYYSLFKEYQCLECLVDPRSVPDAELCELVGDLVARRDIRRKALLTCARAVKEQIHRMWTEIGALLTNSTGGHMPDFVWPERTAANGDGFR